MTNEKRRAPVPDAAPSNNTEQLPLRTRLDSRIDAILSATATDAKVQP